MKTYPVSRKKIIASKLMLIVLLTFIPLQLGLAGIWVAIAYLAIRNIENKNAI